MSLCATTKKEEIFMRWLFKRLTACLGVCGLLCVLFITLSQPARAETITFRFSTVQGNHGENVWIDAYIRSDTDPAQGGGFSSFNVTITRKGAELINYSYADPEGRAIKGISLSIGRLLLTDELPTDQALNFVCKVYRHGAQIGEGRHSNYIPGINHPYVRTVTQQGCTTPEAVVDTCSICGHEIRNETAPALGHDYICQHDDASAGFDSVHQQICRRDASHNITQACSFSVLGNRPATCTEAGSTLRLCQQCNYSFVERKDALGHDWTQGPSNGDGTHSKICQRDPGHLETAVPCQYIKTITPPTCTEQGVTHRACELCAYSPPDTVTGALGHDWGLWISRQDGSHARVCQRDNNHEETGGCVYADTVTPPSCMEAGNTLHLCGICGYSLTDAQTDALGHQWGEWLDQQDGTHLRTCQRDPGHLDTAPCEYLALVTPAACAAEGFTTHTCRVCGNSYQDAPVAPRGHVWAAWSSNQAGSHTRVCLRDSAHVETGACSYQDRVTPPDCMASGFTSHSCTVCGHAFRDSEAMPLGHDWDPWTSDGNGKHTRPCRRDASHTEVAACTYEAAVTDPSCTEEGFTTHTCALCGYSHVTAQTPALGHQPGAWFRAQEPSRTMTGLEEQRCLLCGELLQTREIAKLDGMRYGNIACVGGPRFRDSKPGITDRWYSYAVLDLKKEGVTEYPLVASGRYRIGAVLVNIHQGQITLSLRFDITKYRVREQALIFFPDLSSISSQDIEQTVSGEYGFDKELALAQLPQSEGKTLLFIRLLLDYNEFDRGIERI